MSSTRTDQAAPDMTILSFSITGSATFIANLSPILLALESTESTNSRSPKVPAGSIFDGSVDVVAAASAGTAGISATELTVAMDSASHK
jgi:hypothetical protein